jgi:oligopeptide/dipeptide ABC transporter ATP-binding protein
MTDAGTLHALRGATIEARAGEVVGIVGESGCGKSTLASALIALPAANARIRQGAVRLGGEDILTLGHDGQRRLRGRRIAMIFQDAMQAFNPVLPLGTQMVDFQHHLALPATEKRARARAMLARVGIPDPELCLGRYIHELSGGMRQRAGVAAALLMQPEVLVADEPTTALDVTMEAQILHLFRELRRDHQGAIVIVTHHLGVVGELCDRVYVMYAGQVVEDGPWDDVYHTPRHPYTRALIACDPAHLSDRAARLPTIPGRLPDLTDPPPGCAFAARCPLADDQCRTVPPPRVAVGSGHAALCHKAGP